MRRPPWGNGRNKGIKKRTRSSSEKMILKNKKNNCRQSCREIRKTRSRRNCRFKVCSTSSRKSGRTSNRKSSKKSSSIRSSSTRSSSGRSRTSRRTKRRSGRASGTRSACPRMATSPPSTAVGQVEPSTVASACSPPWDSLRPSSSCSPATSFPPRASPPPPRCLALAGSGSSPIASIASPAVSVTQASPRLHQETAAGSRSGAQRTALSSSR
mmetsp:Transcript_69414/g.215480  ORF Transcript_69414/g.215480 Transcript_69414/m.215480 type:complete len:213 (-) Transcript_69414:573-1211(-)